jgi:hypothetical protein
MSKRFLLSAILCALFSPFAAKAEDVQEKVNIEAGADLVGLAIAGTIYQTENFGVPYKRNEMFLVYEIPGEEGIFAWIAVNPWTGDVWDMNECKLLSNPALQKAQAKIKDQFSAKEIKEYERLHSIKPYREYDLEPCP